MSDPTIGIASESAPVRESLSAFCHHIGMVENDTADLWLIDGYHPPTRSYPKNAALIVLGPIPPDLTPTRTLPAPVSLTALRELLAQGVVQKQTVPLRQGWSFDAQQRALTHPKERAIALTEKECALLQSLLQHMPNEVTRETLLKTIWAYDKEVDTHTVETHVYRLRHKLEACASAPFDIVTQDSGYKVAL